ncbi:hypothetical protein SANTM175S_01074 [Streptomyces antimycoticus]
MRPCTVRTAAASAATRSHPGGQHRLAQEHQQDAETGHGPLDGAAEHGGQQGEEDGGPGGVQAPGVGVAERGRPQGTDQRGEVPQDVQGQPGDGEAEPRGAPVGLGEGDGGGLVDDPVGRQGRTARGSSSSADSRSP